MSMMTNRLGTFFAIVGIALIGIYVLSDMAKTPMCNLLVFGAISLGLGILFWMRQPGPPPQETGRFRILKGGKKPDGKKPAPKK
jgi:hypothetical protein